LFIEINYQPQKKGAYINHPHYSLSVNAFNLNRLVPAQWRPTELSKTPLFSLNCGGGQKCPLTLRVSHLSNGFLEAGIS
jgi:hypothetical protein